MRAVLQAARRTGNCYAPAKPLQAGRASARGMAIGMVRAETGAERKHMGPAIALRLRQHLTLTPQVQQALKLLQMSALEFQQEMEQALTSNPFLEENPDAPTPAPREGASVDDVIVPQEPSSGGPLEREQDDWGSLNDAQPTLSQHMREQLMSLPKCDPDRWLTNMIIDSLEYD